MTTRFTTVICCSDVWTNTDTTLRALERTMREAFECIVLANGIESAPLPARIKSQIISSQRRIGWGTLLNAACERASGRFIALFAAGAVPQPYWSDAAASMLEPVAVIAASPRLLDDAGRVVRACGIGLRAGRLEFRNAGLPFDAIAVLRPSPIDVAPLCGLVLRRAGLTDVGGFDPDFDASLFDVDWSLRARVKGHTIAYRPDFTVRFSGPLSIGRTVPEFNSAERFLERWQTLLAPALEPELFMPRVTA